MPKSVKEAFRPDKMEDQADFINGNLWRMVIEKEMAKAQMTFRKLDGHLPDDLRWNKALVSFEEIEGHMTFDAKLDEKLLGKHILLLMVGGTQLTPHLPCLPL